MPIQLIVSATTFISLVKCFATVMQNETILIVSKNNHLSTILASNLSSNPVLLTKINHYKFRHPITITSDEFLLTCGSQSTLSKTSFDFVFWYDQPSNGISHNRPKPKIGEYQFKQKSCKILNPTKKSFSPRFQQYHINKLTIPSFQFQLNPLV